MAKEIKLTQGKVATVDNSDFEFLNQFKWSFSGHKNKAHGYAVRRIYPNGRQNKGVTILLHRYLMNAPIDRTVDHIDGNTLNCQRHNLRVCDIDDNKKNRSKNVNNTSGYKGVSWHKANKYWVAHIRADKRRFYLGIFSSKIDAARAYDRAAIKLHGPFARLNFV